MRQIVHGATIDGLKIISQIARGVTCHILRQPQLQQNAFQFRPGPEDSPLARAHWLDAQGQKEHHEQQENQPMSRRPVTEKQSHH